MTLVPMEFRRPMGFEGPLDFRGPMEVTLTNQFVEHRRPFFLRSHQNPKKIVEFSFSFLKFTKLEMPNIWADPGPTFGSRRPYKQLTIHLQYCFLWQIISCSLISLLIIAVRNLERFSDRYFVTAYELIIILKLDLTVKCNIQNKRIIIAITFSLQSAQQVWSVANAGESMLSSRSGLWRRSSRPTKLLQR